jgi:hypothetical protein
LESTDLKPHELPQYKASACGHDLSVRALLRTVLDKELPDDLDGMELLQREFDVLLESLFVECLLGMTMKEIDKMEKKYGETSSPVMETAGRRRAAGGAAGDGADQGPDNIPGRKPDEAVWPAQCKGERKHAGAGGHHKPHVRGVPRVRAHKADTAGGH